MGTRTPLQAQKICARITAETALEHVETDYARHAASSASFVREFPASSKDWVGSSRLRVI